MEPDTVESAGAAARRPGVAGFPLARAQESLWFLEQMTPGTALYNMPEGWRFKGSLDRQAFQRSLEEIVRRHEILRTVFESIDGKPHQVVLAPGAFPLDFEDLTQSPDPEAEAQRFLTEEARRPFDLQRGPLLRLHLLRLADEEHVLLINMHHLVSDAWSFGIFMNELAALYGAFTSGTVSPLRELPIQYVDFSVWQREELAGESFSEKLAYWKKQLGGRLSLLALPTDHPPPATRSHRGATQFFSFPKPLAEDLKRLSRSEGVTLFMTVLAAFKTLLYRYTRQEDIIVGSPLSGRDRVETEGLVGFFINTHALRTNLGGDPSFLEVIRRVRETTLGAYAHQALPFERVVEALQPERDLAQNSLFQVVFGLQTAFTEHWLMPGLETSRIELKTATSKFDWTVLLTETSHDLGLRFEYNTDLFDDGTIARAAGHFKKLLQEVVAAPSMRISQVPLLTDPERHQLLVESNQTGRVYERDRCIHEVFEDRAGSEGDAVALRFEGRELSYAELNARANCLARRLQRCGVGPGVAVGVCLERSPELIVGLLAILKAGGAFVPLDRNYPKERLGFMIEDSGARWVLVDAGFDLDLALPEGASLFHLAAEQTDQDNSRNLGVRVGAEDPAYVMYTSGSTGVPKGASIPHRAVVRLVRNTNYIEILPGDAFLQLAPVSFDASTFEIWGALLNGGKLVLYPPETPSLEELGRTIERERITTLWLTSGLFHQMVDSQLCHLKQVRHLLAGGDALSVAHVLKAREELKECELINGYGPTENTTFSCCYRIPNHWPGGASVPIGKPIGNSRAYVLDPNLEPQPIGIPGELYVGGDGLALGYVRRAALTSEKFVASPFSELNGERLYRTGDLARWLPDGNLEFLGRIDDQLKIRGFRVEPGEVEAVLRQHPDIREVVVAPCQTQATRKCLVAYVVTWPETQISSLRLREFLEARLPPYMVPAYFVPLQELPLTANGKVDRRALPKPEGLQEPLRRVRVPPGTPIEERLMEIWNGLLGTQEIGIHDNFFHVGGHSLLATQLISRIAKTFRVEMPVRVVFEAPTIAELAARVSKVQPKQFADAPIIPRRMGRAKAMELLGRLDQLTERELEDLLQDPGLKQT